jgi:hypothetical protein
MPLYEAAAYIVNHFEELTLYLRNPRLEMSNNARERALRIEKCMLSSSQFRKTRNGRATLDILRTMNATCTAAELELADYLKYIYKHRHEVAENPEAFTCTPGFATSTGANLSKPFLDSHTIELETATGPQYGTPPNGNFASGKDCLRSGVVSTFVR